MTKEQVCADLRALLHSNRNINWLRSNESAAIENALRFIEGSSAEPRAKPQFIGFVRCTFDSSEPMCAHEGYVGVSKDCPEHSSPLGAGADRG